MKQDYCPLQGTEENFSFLNLLREVIWCTFCWKEGWECRMRREDSMPGRQDDTNWWRNDKRTELHMKDKWTEGEMDSISACPCQRFTQLCQTHSSSQLFSVHPSLLSVLLPHHLCSPSRSSLSPSLFVPQACERLKAIRWVILFNLFVLKVCTYFFFLNLYGWSFIFLSSF